MLILFQDRVIAHYAGYTEHEITPVFNLMISYCNGSIRHEAFHQKYASKKFLKGKYSSTHVPLTPR